MVKIWDAIATSQLKESNLSVDGEIPHLHLDRSYEAETGSYDSTERVLAISLGNSTGVSASKKSVNYYINLEQTMAQNLVRLLIKSLIIGSVSNTDTQKN